MGLLGGHKPAGRLRGGKYSAFEAGTRIPFIVRWPGQVDPGVSLQNKLDTFNPIAKRWFSDALRLITIEKA